MGDYRSDKQGSEVEEGGEVKSCVDCGTTKTPLWRSGPAGPKSLCNACGIKSRKKRGSGLGVTKSLEEKKAKKLNIQRSTSSSSGNNNNQGSRIRSGSNNNSKLSQSLKKKLVPLGQEVVFQRSIAERLRRRLGEEEQAAMLLMALSCGYVY